ncbi:MAG: hypothetical protein O7G30_04450, partial [Proteobacteria bacterium]|nr:hypothetical protein [Pseudomonadota bacterium]
LRFQLKSKTSEGKVNLAAIRTAEESYLAEFGAYIAAASAPGVVGTPPGSQKAPWPTAPPPPDFSTIGWGPEGDVFFNYGITINATATAYTASAEADLDADGAVQQWGYAKPDAAGVAIDGLACPWAGLSAMTQVGPCDAAGLAVFGQSVF